MYIKITIIGSGCKFKRGMETGFEVYEYFNNVKSKVNLWIKKRRVYNKFINNDNNFMQ